MPRRLFPFVLSLLVLVTSCASPAGQGMPGRAGTATISPVASATPASSAASTAVAVADATVAPATAAPSLAPPSGGIPASPELVDSPNFLGANAKMHVDVLASAIGSRPIGSPNVDSARDYLARQLRSFRYQVETPSFPVRQLDDRGSAVTMDAVTVGANALANSAPGTVSGDLVAAGLGRDADFPPSGVDGQIVLVERGGLTFQQKIENAQKAGAAAVVVSNNQPGNFRGALATRSSIPALSISDEDGARLRDRLRDGITSATVSAVIRDLEQPAFNVVGTLPGSSDRMVVIGAHYDSVPAGPGANDNASGTAAILELARVLARRGPKLTIKVVAFGAEEVGLVGSRAYVSGLNAGERAKIVAMLNFDMVGVGDRPAFGGTPEVVNKALGLANQERLSGAARLPLEPGTSSDHASFAAAGIPNIFFHWRDDPNFHTSNDRAEFVNPEHIEAMGRVALQLVDELAAASS